MQPLSTLQNPPHHGTPTTFLLDPQKQTWLLLGTSRGILNLWDLRFALRLRAFGIPPFTPIRRLVQHPSRGHGKWVVVAGGAAHGDITVWDIERVQCREIFRSRGSGGGGLEAYRIDDDSPEGPLGRFAVEPDQKLDLPVGGEESVFGLVVGRDVNRVDGADAKHTGAFLISAGADRKVRFWDLSKSESSSVVSGLELEEPRPTFVSLQVPPTPVQKGTTFS
jgi:phosphoinositide-3-kinase, regulatory subunit 4